MLLETPSLKEKIINTFGCQKKGKRIIN